MEKSRRRRAARAGQVGSKRDAGLNLRDMGLQDDGPEDTALHGYGCGCATAAPALGCGGQDPGISWPPDRSKNACGADPVLEPLWRRNGVTALQTFDLTEQERAVSDLIRPEFDAAYYLLTNQDVCDAALDPLHHYVR